MWVVYAFSSIRGIEIGFTFPLVKGTGLSSFKLLQSGLVDKLLAFATSEAQEGICYLELALAVVLTVDALLVDLDHCHELLVSSFSPLHTPATSSSSVATLVK